MKYSLDEILRAVREQLIWTNKQLGIGLSLSDDDYKYLGVVAAAFARLKPGYIDVDQYAILITRDGVKYRVPRETTYNDVDPDRYALVMPETKGGLRNVYFDLNGNLRPEWWKLPVFTQFRSL